MPFLMFSLVFLMSPIVFNVFSVLFTKTSLEICCVVPAFGVLCLCRSVCCYAKFQFFYSCFELSSQILQRARPLWSGASEN